MQESAFDSAIHLLKTAGWLVLIIFGGILSLVVVLRLLGTVFEGLGEAISGLLELAKAKPANLRKGPKDQSPPRAFLVVIAGSYLGKVYPLPSGPHRIGGSPLCDIQMTGDPEPDCRAMILTEDPFALVARSADVYVNEQAVESGKRNLHDGDRIRVGNSVFDFLTPRNRHLAYYQEMERRLGTEP